MKRFFKQCKPGDLVAAGAVLLLALAAALLFLPRAAGAPDCATVQIDGVTVRQIALPAEETVSFDNGVTVRVSGYTAWVEESDCPDKTCVRTGVLSRAGERAVCLPNRTVLSLSGADEAIVAGGVR